MAECYGAVSTSSGLSASCVRDHVGLLVSRRCSTFDTLRPKQHGCQYPDDILEWQYINFDWNFIDVCPRCPISGVPALVQVIGADQATNHYLTQWWLVCWRIYASLGLSELKFKGKLNFTKWTVEYDYLYTPEIPASGTNVLVYSVRCYRMYISGL